MMHYLPPHHTSRIADKQCCGRFHRELSSDEEQAQDDSGSVSSSGSSVEGETFALEDGARWAQHARLNQARSPSFPGVQVFDNVGCLTGVCFACA